MRKFYNKYPDHDKILAFIPLILLFFINKYNIYFVLPPVIASFIYWNNKNIYTHIIDIICANIFIFYVLKKSIKQKTNKLYLALMILLMIYFFISSYINGLIPKSQLFEHMVFRSIVLILFLGINYKDNDTSL